MATLAATDVNRATQAEIERIKGIGVEMSTRILDEREKREFKDWADLVARVKGIGTASAARFSAAGLSVNGAAFAGASMAASASSAAVKAALPTPASAPAAMTTPAAPAASPTQP